MTEQKLYKCQHCGKQKPADQFYTGQRQSPFCKSCNTEAHRLRSYKAEAKADPRAFAQKMQTKENQINLMLRALREIQV